MTKSQLVQKLAEAGDIPKKQADAVLDGLVKTIVGRSKKAIGEDSGARYLPEGPNQSAYGP